MSRRKAGRKRKQGAMGKAVTDYFIRPTEQRLAHNDFQSAGAAMKLISPIDKLYDANVLSERQFNALVRYSDVANAAERSEIKSNIDFSVYETGEGLPHFGVRMNIELGRLERELGSLREIARALCVEEISLSQWAMRKNGSVERKRPGKGGELIVWHEPSKKALGMATLELRVAAERLASALRY